MFAANRRVGVPSGNGWLNHSEEKKDMTRGVKRRSLFKIKGGDNLGGSAFKANGISTRLEENGARPRLNCS